MAQFYDEITPEIREFIEKQHMFFVGTAPLQGDGHVNLSPKGQDCFRILGTNRVAYLDLAGSGNETAAHVGENGRITFMFCAFEGAPDIIRLYGTGHAVLPETPEWDEMIPHFDQMVGQRQIIVADIHKTQTSCGYSVPYYDFVGHRDTLNRYWEVKGEEELEKYIQEKNTHSIDGIPTKFAGTSEKD